jgi:hypothetical protein
VPDPSEVTAAQVGRDAMFEILMRYPQGVDLSTLVPTAPEGVPEAAAPATTIAPGATAPTSTPTTSPGAATATSETVPGA